MQKRTKPQQTALPPLERILIIGNGGRENSLAWALSKCNGVKETFVSPGNGGTESLKGCIRLSIDETESEQLINFCLNNQIDLVVIGPEAPLAAGLADDLRNKGLIVFGPGAKGALLEASKQWAKQLMKEGNIPTANHWAVTNKEEALQIAMQIDQPLVVKANGLAAGKGVIVPDSLEETIKAIENSFKEEFGSEGDTILLEEKLQGPEVSIFALSDGKDFILLPPAQDHKRLEEGDKGPNTGGMGAYAPANLLTKKDLDEISELIIRPTLKELKTKGIDYRGVIYAGLMITKNGPKVIEFNCRFGDPECQALMPLIGNELAQVLFACALGELSKAPKLSVSKSCSACVVAAASGYPTNTRTGDSIEILLKENSSIRTFQAGTKLNDNGELVTSGGRVLSVVGEADNFDDAFKKVYLGLKEIYFSGMNYRKDIGHQVRNSKCI